MLLKSVRWRKSIARRTFAVSIWVGCCLTGSITPRSYGAKEELHWPIGCVIPKLEILEFTFGRWISVGTVGDQLEAFADDVVYYHLAASLSVRN